MEKRLPPVFLLLMMLMSMTAGAIALNKVSPIISIIIPELNLSGSAQGGLLISVFAVSGVFLAVPIGVIMQKFGCYKAGIFALSALVIGPFIGMLYMNFAVLLISRVIEGVGLIILTTIGPAVIAHEYKDRNLGAAMGILMCFMILGQIIMLNAAPRIAAFSSWKIVWMGTAAYALIFLLLWIFMLKKLDWCMKDEMMDGENRIQMFPKEVFLNWKLWCLGLTFMLALIAQQGVVAFLPSYLTDVKGMPASAAGSMVSAAAFVGIPTAILSGIISDRLGSRKRLIVIFMVMSSIVYAVMPIFPSSQYILIILLFGISVYGIVGLCISTASELVGSQNAGMAVAFMNMMQWGGIVMSSAVFGSLIDGIGYTGAFYCLVPITIAGALLTFIV